MATETFVSTNWKQGIDISEYLRNVQKSFFECMGIIEQPTIAVSTKYPALNDICFSFLGDTNRTFEIANTTATIEELSVQGAGGIFKIYQEVMAINGEYYVSMEYQKNYVSEAMLEEFVNEYDRLLQTFNQ